MRDKRSRAAASTANDSHKKPRGRKSPDAAQQPARDNGPVTPAGKPPKAARTHNNVRRSLTTGRVICHSLVTKQPHKPQPEVGLLSYSLAESANSLGLTLRGAKLEDVDNLSQAHTRFEIEMARWSAGVSGSQDVAVAEDITDGIRDIILQEGDNSIILLTRELERGRGEIVGFVYSFDESIAQSTWFGTSAYIAQVFIAAAERGQGLGELLLSAALAAALSRGTYASHLYLCPRNTEARRLYEKAGYGLDGNSGDTVHESVYVNPLVNVEAIAVMLAARRTKCQTRLRRTASGLGSRGQASIKASGERQHVVVRSKTSTAVLSAVAIVPPTVEPAIEAEAAAKTVAEAIAPEPSSRQNPVQGRRILRKRTTGGSLNEQELSAGHRPMLNNANGQPGQHPKESATQYKSRLSKTEKRVASTCESGAGDDNAVSDAGRKPLRMVPQTNTLRLVPR